MSENINTIDNIIPNGAEQKGESRRERISHLKEEIKKIEKELKNQDLTDIHREMLEEGKKDLAEYIKILENFDEENIIQN